MSRVQLRHIYEPWTPGIQPEWSVDGIRSALRMHEDGQFAQSAKLVDAMGRDDRLSAVRTTWVNGLLGLPFKLEPAGESVKEIAARDEIERRWYDMLPEAVLAAWLDWFLMLGYSPGELRWQTKAKFWQPTLYVHHPQYTYYDQLSGKFLQTVEEGQVLIEPGNGKWCVLTDGERGYMAGKVRSVAVTWIGHQFALRDWLRQSERLGMPVVLAKVPAMSNDAQKDDFLDDLASLATETTVTLPQGIDERGSSFDVSLLEASMDSAEGFERLMRHIETSFAVAVLGSNLTTQVDGGSFAATTEHGEQLYRTVFRPNAEKASTAIRNQFLKPVCAVNYGDPELAPWPKWDATPPIDAKQKADALKTTGDALVAIANAGYAIKNIEEISEKTGVEIVAIESVGQTPNVKGPKQGSTSQDAKKKDPGVDMAGEQLSAAGTRRGRGFVEGQVYVDSVVDEAVRLASRDAAGDLKKIVQAIDGAADYPELREKLRAIYGDMSPTQFAELMEKAQILSELAGIYATQRDL